MSKKKSDTSNNPAANPVGTDSVTKPVKPEVKPIVPPKQKIKATPLWLMVQFSDGLAYKIGIQDIAYRYAMSLGLQARTPEFCAAVNKISESTELLLEFTCEKLEWNVMRTMMIGVSLNRNADYQAEWKEAENKKIILDDGQILNVKKSK